MTRRALVLCPGRGQPRPQPTGLPRGPAFNVPRCIRRTPGRAGQTHRARTRCRRALHRADAHRRRTCQHPDRWIRTFGRRADRQHAVRRDRHLRQFDGLVHRPRRRRRPERSGRGHARRDDGGIPDRQRDRWPDPLPAGGWKLAPGQRTATEGRRRSRRNRPAPLVDPGFGDRQCSGARTMPSRQPSRACPRSSVAPPASLKLPLHSAFHTPLLTATRLKADLLWRGPRAAVAGHPADRRRGPGLAFRVGRPGGASLLDPGAANRSLLDSPR